MNGDRSHGGGAGGGAGPEVEDEFACAGVLRRPLASVHGTVERIFKVTFGIGSPDLDQSDSGQMWLKLRGSGSNVEAAKLFVRGVVNQEEQQELSYPDGLRCVFCGARELFLNGLIRSTSAQIVVGSPGSLLISGLAEPVVRAYSLIADLAERYDSAQSQHSETGDQGLRDSLESRRAFKALVEEWEDRHTLDLLVLPYSVKEILLDLVQESGLGSPPMLSGGNVTRGSEVRWAEPNAMDGPVPGLSGPPDPWSAGLRKDSYFQTGSTAAGTRGSAEGAEERLSLPPQEVGEEGQLDQGATFGPNQGEELEGDDELEVHLKFFTAMGYTKDVVKRVLAQTGPKEASQILDLVQQEQDRSEQDQDQDQDQDQNPDQTGVPAGRVGHNRPCESEHMETEGNGEEGPEEEDQVVRSSEGPDPGREEDFVLGVLKSAAASCGYAEQKVAKVYHMLPSHSTHQLLLELQRDTGRGPPVLREGPREMDDVVLEDRESRRVPTGGGARGHADHLTPPEKKKGSDPFAWNNESQQSAHQRVPPMVKGPPEPTYISSRDPLFTPSRSDRPLNQDWSWPPSPPTSNQNHAALDTPSPLPSKPKQSFHAAPPDVFRADDPSPTTTRTRRMFPPAPPVVVTGEQRFLEGLQAPFQLKLTDQPGDPRLRTIIIDASNVAMSHGLTHFFSCRGIALAVQHFWDRGHRHISAMLPQWRQKSDPKIKEQHYLSELQTVGLLSFTPSREVHGKRISSYDDRLMLQLAQKTDGVIVTNDNLRDLLDESHVWRDIIKKRLLQYTFVGDHFMVPDDPLGRAGPHLDDFLRADRRTPGSRSSAGAASALPFSRPSQLFNFRGPSPGGASETWAGVQRAKGSAGGKGWSARDLHGPAGAELGGGGGGAARSAAETTALRAQLCQVFPGQDNMVTLALQCHPLVTDVNVLSDLILEEQEG